ncbi:MAG: hypothetical protein ACXWZR_13960, partial [Mycobacterium sp.]
MKIARIAHLGVAVQACHPVDAAGHHRAIAQLEVIRDAGNSQVRADPGGEFGLRTEHQSPDI